MVAQALPSAIGPYAGPKSSVPAYPRAWPLLAVLHSFRQAEHGVLKHSTRCRLGCWLQKCCLLSGIRRQTVCRSRSSTSGVAQ